MVYRTLWRVKVTTRNPELFRHISPFVPSTGEDLHRSSPGRTAARSVSVRTGPARSGPGRRSATGSSAVRRVRGAQCRGKSRGDSGRRIGARRGHSLASTRHGLAAALALVTVAGLGAACGRRGVLATPRRPTPDRHPAHHPPHLAAVGLHVRDRRSRPPPAADQAAPGSLVTGRRRPVRPLPDRGRRPLPAVHQRRHRAGPVNVPVATSTDFVHWTDPVDALPDPAPLGRSRVHLGARPPPLRQSATPSTSPPMFAGHRPRPSASAAPSPTRPPVRSRPIRPRRSSASSTRAAPSIPGCSSTTTAHPGCCGSPTRTSGGRPPRPRCGPSALSADGTTAARRARRS